MAFGLTTYLDGLAREDLLDIIKNSVPLGGVTVTSQMLSVNNFASGTNLSISAMEDAINKAYGISPKEKDLSELGNMIEQSILAER